MDKAEEKIENTLVHEPLTFEQMKEMQAIILQHDWETLRNQAAIAAMQGLLANPYRNRRSVSNDYVELAIDYANALVEQLKKRS